ncbi:MAG: acylphosphatase [Planctomycetota bacterium]
MRVTVHFSGRVQGVGFRYTAASTAERFAIAGYVQNLPDGRVRLVGEGTKAEIDAYLDALTERMRRGIVERLTDWSQANGEFGDPTEGDTFAVRY